MIHHSLSLWPDEDRPLRPVAHTRIGDLVTGSGRTTKTPPHFATETAQLKPTQLVGESLSMFLQLLANGLVTGSVIALAAAGVSIV